MDALIDPKNRHIQVVVNVSAGDTMPILSISAKIMEKMSNANLSIDVDLYAWQIEHKP